MRLEIRKSTPLKSSDEIVGHTTVVKVVKNKVAPPLRSATFDLVFGKGICKEGELLDEGVRLGLVTRSGAWFKFNLAPNEESEQQQQPLNVPAPPAELDVDQLSQTPFAQGRDKAKTFLEENSEVSRYLETRIRALSAPPTTAEESKEE